MSTPRPLHQAITIPPASLTRLEQLITQRDTLDGQIQTIVVTLRDAVNVPENYVIGDIRRGFTPPEQEQKSDA